MIATLLLISSVINGKINRFISILGVVVSTIIIFLGAAGVLNKEGPVEHLANEFISNTLGVPLEELEKLEHIK